MQPIQPILARIFQTLLYGVIAILLAACGAAGLPPEPASAPVDPPAASETQAASETPASQKPLASTATLEPTPTLTTAPTYTRAAVPTYTRAPTQPPLPTMDPQIIQNPDFEEDSAWKFKAGALQITGGYAYDWSPSGRRSYKVSVHGDDGCRYYFQPGQRSSVTQPVDLTGIEQIWFDLYLWPSDSFANKGIARLISEVRIDQQVVYTTDGKGGGEKLAQRIQLEPGQYTGRHSLSFSLMFASEFCSFGDDQTDAVAMYVDDVRLYPAEVR